MTHDQENTRPVVITGGATGIGFEIALQLLKIPDYRLILISPDKTQLDTALSQLPADDQVRVSGLVCDLRDEKEIQKLGERVAALTKHLYGVINNAGIYPFGGISNTTAQQWGETLSVNLTAPFLLTQTLLPLLRKSEGGARIINLSSTAGILPNHFALAYSVSKAGLIHFTKTIAKELGPEGITVNCVCPGIVRSPMHDTYHHSKSALEAFYAKKGSGFPMGRVGEPKDVANVVKFFLSEDASWCTGDVFLVDGGRLLV